MKKLSKGNKVTVCLMLFIINASIYIAKANLLKKEIAYETSLTFLDIDNSDYEAIITFGSYVDIEQQQYRTLLTSEEKTSSGSYSLVIEENGTYIRKPHLSSEYNFTDRKVLNQTNNDHELIEFPITYDIFNSVNNLSSHTYIKLIEKTNGIGFYFANRYGGHIFITNVQN